MINRKSLLMFLLMLSMALFAACGGAQEAAETVVEEAAEVVEDAAEAVEDAAEAVEGAAEDVVEDAAEVVEDATDGDMMEEITVAYFLEWPTPNQFAQLEETYDEAMGVKVNWVSFDTGVAMSAAMASGDVQIAYSQGLVPFANAVSAGLPLKMVGVAVSYAENDNCVVGASAGIGVDNVTDLHGQKVAVPIGTVAHYKMLREMEHLGVDVAELEIVDLAPADGAAALERGDVAMACGWGGALARMKENGDILMTGAEMEEIGIKVFDVISVTEDFAASHPDMVSAFLQVTEDANAMYQADPASMQDTIAEAAGMDLDGSNAVLANFSFPSKDQQLSADWFGGTVQAFIKDVADFFVEQGELDAALDSYDGTIDTSFLEGINGFEAMAMEESMDDSSADMAMGSVTGAFAGETVEIIIPYGEGGGSDTWTRALVPFLQTYLGDDVTVQAVNMKGASGTVGAIEFAQVRDHDGLSLLVSSGSNALPWILGDDRVDYDFAQFTGVMGSPVGGVVYTSPDTGITSLEDLCATDAELIYGGISPTGLDLVPLLAFDQMGLDFLGIMGYDGRGAARVAFEQGEINLDYQTTPAFVKNVQPLVDEGAAVPLFAIGVIDANGDFTSDPVYSDLPTAADAIAACGGATDGAAFEGFKAAATAGFAAQKNLWVHGDAPADRIADLTAAAQMTLADEDFQAIAKELVGDYEFYAGAEAVGTAFGAAGAMSDAAFDYLVGFLNDNYDAGLSGVRPGGSAAAMDDGAMAMGEVTGAFAGETIEVIIPYGEGGGSDTWTRALTPFLQTYLGEDVTVQAVNMKGASGTVGAIEFAQIRDHDGLSLLVSSGSNTLPWILGDERVDYDFTEFAGVMGSPVGGVVYTSPDTGITSLEDLCATDAELIYGGISPTGLDMVPLLAFDRMGLDFLGIMGYDGRGAARVAFEQGEINLDYQTTPAFVKNVMPLVEEGSAVPLFTFGVFDDAGNIVADPAFPDWPTSADAIAACGGATEGVEYDAYKAAFTAGFAAQKNLWVHGDAPAERIADLTAAAQMTLADADFQAIAAELVGEYEFYAGAEAVNTSFGAANNMSDDSFSWLVCWLTDTYEVELPASSNCGG